MVDPRVTLKRMQIADQRWRVAIEESAFAPPDDRFGHFSEYGLLFASGVTFF